MTIIIGRRFTEILTFEKKMGNNDDVESPFFPACVQRDRLAETGFLHLR